MLALKARWAKIDAEYPDVAERALKQDKGSDRGTRPAPVLWRGRARGLGPDR